MLCHVVLYRLKPGISEEDKNRLIDEARTKLALLPGVSNLKVGRGIAGQKTDYSVGLVMDFQDEAVLEAYRVNPDHQRFVREVVQPLVAEIWRFDFTY